MDNTTVVPREYTIKHRISWLLRKSSPVVLKGRAASKTIDLLVPDLRTVVSAKLHLVGANSATLIGAGSQLLISINGNPIKQLALDGASSIIDKKFSLPLSSFRNGRNRITLSAIQKSSRNCQVFNSPDLWTRIVGSSTLAVTYRRPTQPPSFAEVRQIFATAGGSSKIMILYDTAFRHRPEAIMAAARALARLEGREPLHVLARPLDPVNQAVAQTFPGPVVILQPPASHDAASGQPATATLSMARNGVGSIMLTIKGTSAGATARAARLVGGEGVVWPHAAMAKVVVPPPGPETSTATSDRQVIATSFKAAGDPTRTEYGSRSKFPTISFWNPSWGSHAILYLHVAYSAGGAAGSMIQAIVNGKMVNTIPLSSVDGGTYPDYKLLIPQDSLEVGLNTLVLKPVFRTHHVSASACTATHFGSALAVTVFSDSHLSVIGGSAVGKDDLAAVRLGVYRINRVAITDGKGTTISAAATLGAKLAQVVAGGPVRMAWEHAPKSTSGTLIVGAEGTVPVPLLEHSGIAVAQGTAAITEPADENSAAAGEVRLGGVTSWLDATFSSKGSSARMGPPPSYAGGRPATVEGFADSAILVLAHAKTGSPAPGLMAPAILLTAPSDGALERAVDSLVDRHVWEQVSGQAVVVTPDSPTLQVMPAMNVPTGTSARLGYFATRNPVAMILVILGVLGILVLILRAFVTLRRRRLHPSVRGVDER